MDKLDELIDEMFEVREKKRGLEAEIKQLKADLGGLEERFKQACKEAGTDYARGTLASASVTKQLVPTVVDWDLVYEYIKKEDAMYLLHRRVSVAAWKELMDAGIDLPGIEAYEVEGVSLLKKRD